MSGMGSNVHTKASMLPLDFDGYCSAGMHIVL